MTLRVANAAGCRLVSRTTTPHRILLWWEFLSVVGFLTRSGHRLTDASAEILGVPHPFVLRLEHRVKPGHGPQGFKEIGTIIRSRKDQRGHFVYCD